jgi:nitrous oxide reductase
MGRRVARKTDFVDNSVCNSVTNCYNSDGLVSLHAIMQSKNNYLIIFEVQN